MCKTEISRLALTKVPRNIEVELNMFSGYENGLMDGVKLRRKATEVKNLIRL